MSFMITLRVLAPFLFSFPYPPPPVIPKEINFQRTTMEQLLASCPDRCCNKNLTFHTSLYLQLIDDRSRCPLKFARIHKENHSSIIMA
ncbi:hypothetical protein F5888DRAFT_1642982 [Russula emetica]|nr:hypothetical protein F5888DRAFT_1642982 [Russula emetica]